MHFKCFSEFFLHVNGFKIHFNAFSMEKGEKGKGKAISLSSFTFHNRINGEIIFVNYSLNTSEI